MSSKTKQLILLLVGLALVRFGIIPLLEWQSSTKTELQLLAKQQKKIEHIVANAEVIRTELRILKNAEQESRSVFPMTTTENYRLELQQKLERIFSSNQVQIQVFDWLTVETVEDSLVRKALVNVRVAGKVPGIVQSQAALDTLQNIKLQDMTLSWFSALNKQSELAVQMNLAVYYQVESNE